MSAVDDEVELAARPRRAVSTRLFRSEIRLIAGRRRNQGGLAVLAAIPVILAVAVKVTTGPPSGEGPPFMDTVEINGLFVPLAALGVEITMFLPLAVAMLCGDSIAGEANIGTLRGLLTVPVGRTRLLAVKYAALCVGAAIGVVTVAVTGAVIGIALFGTGPMPTLSGTQLDTAETVGRLALVCLYFTISLGALAAVGLFVSTLTEQPMAATVVLVLFTLTSAVLQTIAQLDWLHPWLLTNQWDAFGDLLRDPIYWTDISKGVGISVLYAVVFWFAAWARFGSKDITS